MVRTIGEASLGNKSAEKSLNQIGLSAEKLKSLSPDQQFTKIAEEISKIQNPAQRLAATMDIFGKGGAGLVNALSGGAEGLAKAQREAEKLNLTLSRADAAKVEAMNDSVGRLQSSFKGAFQQFAIGLAPAITNFGNSGTSAFGAVARKVGEFVSTGIKEIGFFFGTMDVRWQLLKVNAAITWDTMKALAAGFYSAAISGMVAMAMNVGPMFGNILKIGVATWEGLQAGVVSFFTNFQQVFTDMGQVVLSFAAATAASLEAAFNMENPIAAFNKTLVSSLTTFASTAASTIGADAKSAFSNSIRDAGGLAEIKSVMGAMGAGFNEGFEQALDPKLDAEKKRLEGQLADIRRTFDQMGAGKDATAKDKEGIGAFAGIKAMGVSSQRAAATQIGTTEAASQITASMTAFNKKDDEIAKNTGLTVEKLEQVKNAISENAFPEFDMIPSF